MFNLLRSQCYLAIASILSTCSHVTCHVTGVADTNAPPRLNLINDASFERDDDVTAWTMSDRMSMWTVERRARVSRDCDVSRTGRCSLRLDGVEAGKFRAVFVSQYINQSSLSGPIRVEFWIRGNRLDHFRLQLDVSYVDPRRQLTVDIKSEAEVAAATASANRFKRKCVVVPDYGSVRAMMLHLVVEAEQQSGSDVIHVDDVIVSNHVTDDVVRDCQPYMENKPHNRRVVADFLSPVKSEPEMNKATSCGPGSDTGDDVITLATQLSVDRLPTLDYAASLWTGPVSAAILIFDDDVIGSIAAAYNRSTAMRSCVTIHLVHAIERDAELFPVNFLRNIAIAHARSGRVFYVDVDVIPTFSEQDARRWVDEASQPDSSSCSSSSGEADRRAFVAPAFNVKSPASQFFDAGTGHCSLPRTKTDLLDRLHDPGSGFEPVYSVSHSIVNYRHWYLSTEPYEVKYRQNAEPYFIVRSSAPVMNDFYAGYGRDKCAYSRDLAELGYHFIVLPEAFLINVYEESDQWTIFRRSRGVQLGVFLNAAFHEEDIRARYFRYPADYNCRISGTTRRDEEFQDTSSKLVDVNELENPKIYLESEHLMPTQETSSNEQVDQTIEASDMESAMAQNTMERRSDPERKTSSNDVVDAAVNRAGIYHERQKCAADSEDNVNREVCHGSDSSSCSGLLFHDLPTLTLSNKRTSPDRLDIIVEFLMIDYGVTTYIQVGSGSVTGSVSGMLPMNQPDAIITAMPYSNVAQKLTTGVFTSYRSIDGPSPLLSTIVADFLGPKLYLFDINSAEIVNRPGNMFQEYVDALAEVATDRDVIVVVGSQDSSSFTEERVQLLCRWARRRSGWTLYRVERFLALKPDSLLAPPPLLLPPFPVCPYSDGIARPDVESTEWKPVVDVILLTKNRPLQTFAFLDGLSTFVSGVNTVWIVFKSEGPLYYSGYQLVKSCFQATEKNVSFHVELVDEVNGLGWSVMDVLRSRSAASHVMLAVDELMWLDKVDVVDVAQLLPLCHTGQDSDEIFSAQLRLGNNIRDFQSFLDSDKRFLHLANFSASSTQRDLDNLYAYYPRRLPYDFGYILNIDGAVFRRRDILSDFESANSDRCRIPGCLEQGLIRRCLHRRSRQWQLTYSSSRLVNNQLEDGRVAARNEGPSDASRRLAATLVEDRRKIDVMSFAEKHQRPRSVHVWQPVEYIDLDSAC